jgi:hypothetical protein
VTLIRGTPGDRWVRSEYDHPEPGGFTTWAKTNTDGLSTWWDAEFRINVATVGGGGTRDIRIAAAQQWLACIGDDYGWSPNYRWAGPNTWAVGHVSSAPP